MHNCDIIPYNRDKKGRILSYGGSVKWKRTAQERTGRGKRLYLMNLTLHDESWIQRKKKKKQGKLQPHTVKGGMKKGFLPDGLCSFTFGLLPEKLLFPFTVRLFLGAKRLSYLLFKNDVTSS